MKALVLRKEISYMALAVCILTDLSPEEAFNRLYPPTWAEKMAVSNALAVTIIEMRSQGMGYAEIGRQLGMGRGTVYRRIQQYRERLKREG